MKGLTLARCLCLIAFSQGVVRAQAQSVPDVKPAASICGDWVVESVLQTSNVQVSPEALRKFVGLRAQFGKLEARIGNRRIKRPVYKVTRVSDAEFFKNNAIPLTKLGIRKKNAVIVNVQNSAGNDVTRFGTEIVIKNHNEVITTWDGGYFQLVRTAPCRVQ